MELVDYYGGTFMRLFAAIAETIGVFWIYGMTYPRQGSSVTTETIIYYDLILNYSSCRLRKYLH